MKRADPVHRKNPDKGTIDAGKNPGKYRPEIFPEKFPKEKTP
jgi:hypothetical protein